MNVLIITEEDVFYVYSFFKHFFPLSKKHDNYNIKAISVLEPFDKKSKFALAKQMYNFYGFFNFFLVGTKYVFRKIMGQTIKNLAKNYNVINKDTKNVNTTEYIDWIKENNIDIILSIAAPQIFKKDLLKSVPQGCVNSHSALLPENKGMMPVFWGLYKKSDSIGVTVHYMAEKLDAGDIILQEEVPVKGESLDEMIYKTKKISAYLIDEALCQISEGTEKIRKMPSGGSYQTFPNKKEVKEFKKRGNRIF